MRWGETGRQAVVRRRFVSAFPSIPRLPQPPKGVGALERLVFFAEAQGVFPFLSRALVSAPKSKRLPRTAGLLVC